MDREGDWPPAHGLAYVFGEAFCAMLLELGEALAATNPTMDFSTAAAEVFAWFDEKLKAEPDFIADNFSTPAMLRGYVRKSLLNEARRVERGRRKEIQSEAPAIEAQPGSVSADEGDAVRDALKSLSELEQQIVLAIAVERRKFTEVARNLGLHRKKVARYYESALDALRSAVEREKRGGRGTS